MVEPEKRIGPRVAKLKRQVFRVAEPSEVIAGKALTQTIGRPIESKRSRRLDDRPLAGSIWSGTSGKL
jgi:hypothetical protein